MVEPSSYWLNDTFPKFNQSPHCSSNIVIIGAGISGISTAYWLLKLGVEDITIIDKDYICSGATGRNGGHVWPLPTLHYEDDFVKKYGIDEIEELDLFYLKNVELIEDFLKEHDKENSCEFMQKGGLSVAIHDDKEYNELIDIVSRLGKNGLAQKLGLELLDNNDTTKKFVDSSINSFGKFRSIYTSKAYQIWPSKFVDKILEVCLKMGGLKVYTKIRVDAVSNLQVQYTNTKTNTTGTIDCNKIIYCTNAWSKNLIPKLFANDKLLYPVRNHVIMTSPIPIKIMQSDMNLSLNLNSMNKYFYLIKRPDNRLVVGTKIDHDDVTNTTNIDSALSFTDRSNKLIKLLIEVWPALQNLDLKVEANWIGVLAYTLDGNPFVGKIDRNEYVCVGFCGGGMVKCFGAAKALAKTIFYDKNFLTKCFDPNRFN